MSALSLAEAVDLVEALRLDDQKLLRSLLSDHVYKKKAVRLASDREDFDALEKAGLVVHVDDPAGFAVSPDACKIARKLCTYLTRRNETDSYFDPDHGYVDFPKGAEFMTVIPASGASYFGPVFRDDEITALLDLHGVNRCRTWQMPPKNGVGL